LVDGTKIKMLQLARILANWWNTITSLEPYLHYLLQVLEFPNSLFVNVKIASYNGIGFKKVGLNLSVAFEV
jgi:hypothetical protein